MGEIQRTKSETQTKPHPYRHLWNGARDIERLIKEAHQKHKPNTSLAEWNADMSLRNEAIKAHVKQMAAVIMHDRFVKEKGQREAVAWMEEGWAEKTLEYYRGLTRGRVDGAVALSDELRSSQSVPLPPKDMFPHLEGDPHPDKNKDG